MFRLRKLKLLFLLTLFSLMSLHTVYSQNTTIKIQGGTVFSTVFMSKTVDMVRDPIDINHRIGYQFNLGVTYPAGDRFGFTWEFGFIKKGYQSKSLSRDLEDIQFANVYLPFLIDFKVVEGVNISIGHEFGFELHTKTKRNNAPTSVDLRSRKRFDTGLLVNLYMGFSKKAGIGLRYGRSISYASSRNGEHFNNTYISAYFSYTFRNAL